MEEETKSTAPASGNDDSPASDQRQRIIDFGSAVSRSSRGNIYTLTIAGQVEGHQVLPETAKTTKYEHVMPLLSSLEQSEEIEGVLLLLNTVGGDIEAGLGIAELVAGMRKPTVSLVLGGGHSIGIPLAVAPKASFIVPSASMTIHPVRMNGTVIAAPVIYGEEAVELGLIDSIGSLSDALDCLYEQIAQARREREEALAAAW